MKAIRVHRSGEPDVLQLEELPTPEPGPGEVLVRVEAAGLNFIDVYQRRGWYAMPLPFTPGMEGAGVIEAIGPEVELFRPGNRVAWAMTVGAYAEYALVPAERLVHVPEDITLEQAAAILLQGMTAHYLARSAFPLRKGDTALIHAAAGGTGQLLVQVARMCGARVIATVSSEAKAALAREAGADEVIIYTQQDFESEVRRLTEGRGVDVVYDSVGRDTFLKGLSCLRPRGFMVLFGQSSGPVGDFDPQLLSQKGSLFLTRPTLAHYMLTRGELLWRSEEVFRWLREGAVRLRIDRTFPLEQAAEAHRYIEGRLTKGKVLLLP
ncbi:MAG: quinone oxidoreductase family protein [Thermoflexales bacterium]